MHPIDWLVVALPVLAVACIALYTRRYVRSVADYMAGGRNAGRFMLCTAQSEMGAGGMSYVTGFEIFLIGGFAVAWWQQLQFPIMLLVAISGFVLYRYRQTRALTLQQFFEIRYSRNFRLVAGVMAFIAGVVNFFIMPLMEAKFLIYFLGFPPVVHLLGYPIATYTLVLGCHLGITALVTLVGGQITVLVTDCTEGMFSMIAYAIIAIVLLGFFFSWQHTRSALLSRPPGYSLVNPFDTAKTQTFNLTYVLMVIAYRVYGTMAWQNQHAFNASATSPHEARMGSIMGQWRLFAGTTMKLSLIVIAITYLATPSGHAAVQHVLDVIARTDPNTAKRMSVPVALTHTLPVGIKGLFVAICLMGGLSANGMHLHSWSSIFIQDIVMPLRKRPLSTREHLNLLRLSVVGVAVIVFLLAYFFNPSDYMALWFMATEAIFVGGAGACIIGGLYWSRGTTAGAWAGMFTGFVLCFGGTVLKNWLYIPLVTHWLPAFGLSSFAAALYHRWPQFPNGQMVNFYGCLTAASVYVIVSLVTCRQPHNMDKLLHRGRYAVEGDEPPVVPLRRRFSLYNLVGITDQFTRGDRWIALSIFGWYFLWFLVFVVVTTLWLLGVVHWSNRAWANYYIITGVFLPGLIMIPTTIWFTVGCTRDLREFFRRLKVEKIDIHDDGTVAHAPAEEKIVPARATAEVVAVGESASAE